MLRLLKAHLQWEVGRREVLGARNRRLLGVSKGVRELQEQKVSLEDQLMVMRNEVTSLNAQLAGVRVSKHQTEEERAESSRIQENEILQLRTRYQVEGAVEIVQNIEKLTLSGCSSLSWRTGG